MPIAVFAFQMLDMVKPIQEGRITLADLKACKMSPLFFDTFFNLEKYLEHEQKDPFANIRVGDSIARHVTLVDITWVTMY